MNEHEQGLTTDFCSNSVHGDSRTDSGCFQETETDPGFGADFVLIIQTEELSSEDFPITGSDVYPDSGPWEDRFVPEPFPVPVRVYFLLCG